jgi:hypothetical protein
MIEEAALWGEFTLQKKVVKREREVRIKERERSSIQRRRCEGSVL